MHAHWLPRPNQENLSTLDPLQLDDWWMPFVGMAELWFWTLVALIRIHLFMSGGSEGRRSAGQTRQAALRWTPKGTSLNKGSCTVRARGWLPTNDRNRCGLTGRWQPDLFNSPLFLEKKSYGGFRFRMSSRFPEGSKKDFSPKCCWLLVVVLNSRSICLFGKGNTFRPLMSLKLRHVGQPESLTYIYWNYFQYKEFRLDS